MADLPTSYSTGTISVGAGSTTVTGTGTSWIAAGLEAGDIFWAAGLSVRIADDPVSATSLTLAHPWPGPMLSNVNYEVRYTPDMTRALASAREVLEALTNGNLASIAALESAANKLAYFTGSGAAALTDLTTQARTLLGGTALSRSGSDYTLNGKLIGTAVTQSGEDTTAGRLVRVGDYGLGVAAGQTPVSYAGAMSGWPSGLSRISGGTTEQPAGVGTGAVLTMANQAGRQGQLVHGTQNNRVYARASHDAAWSAWAMIYAQNTILGTVSQSGGVPTGAVIERGSNANGEYVRFADGTQICTAALTVNGTISAALLGGFRNPGQTWIYPAVFVAVPRVIGAPAALTSLGIVTASASVNAVSVFHIANTSQAAADLVAHMSAIGRWY